MLIGLFIANPAWATFWNAGIYINATNAEYGQTINLNGAIKSDVKRNGVYVRIGLHKVSDQNVIDTTAIFTKDYSGQNFVANQNGNYSVSYTVPASVVTDRYAMVMKVGTSIGGSDLLLAQGIANNWVVNLKGKPAAAVEASYVNTGVYLPVTSIKAGASIVINNSLMATAAAVSTVRLELKKVSDAGVISSSALVTKDLTSQSFVANQSKNFSNTLTIPASAEGGKYILAVSVINSAGKIVFSYNQVASINSFTVIAAENLTDASFTNTGIYIPVTSVKAGASIAVNHSLRASKTISNVVVRNEIRRVSDAGVVSSTALIVQEQTGQNFTANVDKSYALNFVIPANAESGKYILAVFVKASTGASLYSYSEVQAINSFTAINETVVNDVTFTNTGVYIPNPNVKQGASLSITNALKASKAISNVTVRNEIRKVSNTGVVSSAALVVQELTGQNFTANTEKPFPLTYAIPASAEAGKYILAVIVKSSDGKVLFTFAEVMAVNSLVVEAKEVIVTDVYATNTGIYIPNTSVAPGAAITIHNSVATSKDVNNLTVKVDVKNISTNAVIATYSQTGQNFLANQSKNYSNAYAIPQAAAAGSYAVAVTVTNSIGTVLLSYNEVAANNSFTVTGTVTPPQPATGSYVRGINIMDMGIGDVFPGVYNTNYTRPSLQSLQALKDRGMQVVRLPFKWERAQSTLNGPLNSVYMGHIIQMLKDCKTVGLVAILDMHNYARYVYADKSVGVFGASNGPTKVQYADAWIKIANAVRANADAYEALYAYDIMNEPYSLPTNTGITDSQVWETYAQAGVTAIRSTGDNKMIHVEGYQFAAPHRWATLHPKPFITDPANNIMYHAHLYMDNDTSGTYARSYADEETLAISQGYSSVGARGIANLKIFANWCSKNNQKCFLGEFGWPNSAFGGAGNALKWNQAGEEMLDYMDSIRMGGTMWSTGSWLRESDNVLNSYILPTLNPAGIVPLSQSSVLERHMGN